MTAGLAAATLLAIIALTLGQEAAFRHDRAHVRAAPPAARSLGRTSWSDSGTGTKRGCSPNAA